MSITAAKAVWECSRSTRTSRLVLLALADHVNEQRIQAGYPWESWPSQRTLARLCNCSRSAVQEAIERLLELGEIADTGERRRRGTVVWEVLPDLDWTADGSSYPSDDRTGGRSSGAAVATTGPEGGHVTGRFSEMTGPDSDTTGPESGHKPEVEPEQQKNQNIEHRSVSPPAATDVLLPPMNEEENTDSLDTVQATRTAQQQQVGVAERERQAQLLAELEADLRRKPGDEVTARAVEALRGEVGEDRALEAVAA